MEYPSMKPLQVRFVWLAGGLLVALVGCGDQASNPRSTISQERQFPAPNELPISPPQWTQSFSEMEGPRVDWGKMPEKRLYAKKDILNTAAPELIVQKWIGEVPETAGKFVLVDFWATWCGPCREAIPELNQLAKEFSETLVVIGLSDETEEQVTAMREPLIHYFSAIDPAARTKGAIGVVGIPHVVLIDPSGVVCWQGFPLDQQHPLTAEIIQDSIDRYRAAQ